MLGLDCCGVIRTAACRTLASTFATGIIPATHNVDLPDVRAAHEEATMIFHDMARDVAAQLSETPEWRMDVSDESGKSLFRLRLLTEPLE